MRLVLRAPISIGNHTAFLVQFGINLHECVFQKAEIALVKFQLLEKLTSMIAY